LFDPSGVFDLGKSKLILVSLNFFLCVLALVCLFMMSKKTAMILTETSATAEPISEVRT
jgi:hypothetical protein